MIWILFDTATRPDYYKDVHNVLAMPIGTTIEYDYDTRHMAQNALNEVNRAGPSRQTNLVLIVYVQDPLFDKNVVATTTPDEPLEERSAFVSGTRLAHLIETRVKGNRRIFALELRGYPANDGRVRELVAPLFQRKEVPFRTWVALSEIANSFHGLEESDVESDWSKIVNCLGVGPSQFAGDTFWRISSVRRRKGPIPPLSPKRSSDPQYRFRQIDDVTVVISTHTPPDGATPPRALKVSIDKSDGRLKEFIQQPDLRRNDVMAISARVGTSDSFTAEREVIAFETLGTAAGHPCGPSFRLAIQIVKAPARVIIALVLGLSAAGVGAWGVQLLRDTHIVWGILAIVGAGALGVFALAFYSNKLVIPGARAG